MTINLNPDLKNEVQYVYLKSQKSGEITLNRIRATVEGQLDLNFTDVAGVRGWNDGGDNPSDYNVDYEAFVFSGNDKWIDWAYGNDGGYFGEYDYVIIEFAVPCEFEVTLEVTYNPENNYPASVATAPRGCEFVAVPLNKDVPGEYERTDRDDGSMGGGVRDIYIRAQNIEGENWYLYPSRAYLATGECPEMPDVPEPLRADLVVTGLSWTPNVPEFGSQMSFSARVKNIGTAATPDNIKHGCVFQIWNEEAQEYQTESWSDNHYTTVEPGEEVILTSVGNGSTGAPWTYPAGEGFLLRAYVNDTQDFPEKDRENNYSEAVEIVAIEEGEFIPVGDYVSIQTPELNGYIFVQDGILNISGYPANASVTVYNLLGQTIQQDALLQGAYIVEINANGKVYTQKVLVK